MGSSSQIFGVTFEKALRSSAIVKAFGLFCFFRTLCGSVGDILWAYFGKTPVVSQENLIR